MMRRGEIRLVDFEPATGSESNKTRPAVIVSNDRANTASARTNRGVVTVVPLTSNVANIFPFQVFMSAQESGLRLESKAQAEQVRALSVTRIGRVVGRVPIHRMAEIDAALRLHLQL